MSTDKRITLAKLAGAHGVKGIVKIYPLGEDITLLESCDVYTDKGVPVKITLKNAVGKFRLADVDIITTREEALAAKGTELQIDQSALPDIEDDDAFYYHDLVGLKALSDSGEEIGQVIGVDNYGAGDLLEIRLKGGEKFLLPFNDDHIGEVNDTGVTIKDYERYIL